MRYYNPDYRPSDTPFYAAMRSWATGTILQYRRYHSADDRAQSLSVHFAQVAEQPLDDRVFGHPVAATELPADLVWEDWTHTGPDGTEVVCEQADVD